MFAGVMPSFLANLHRNGLLCGFEVLSYKSWLLGNWEGLGDSAPVLVFLYESFSSLG